MAKRRHKRRHGGKRRARSGGGRFVARNNPPRHLRRRHRRNPPRGILALVKSAPAFAGRAAIGAGGTLVGVIGARKVRGLFKQEPGSLLGSAIEIATGLVAGLAACAFGMERLGEAIAAGGILAPTMTFVQNLKIPHVSDSLGDDGYVVGDGTGLTLVSAHPDDYGPVLAEGASPYVGAGGAVNGYTSGRRAVQMDVARVA